MSLIERDLKHLWHPCSQMKDYESFKPVEIERALGSMMYLKDGSQLIDAISSWWCKSLGHCHPVIQKSVIDQMQKFEHVILANTTNDTIVQLVEKISAINPELQKVFFADSGSDAVEVACKMALQYHAQTGNPQKNQLLALQNGYHGETTLTLAIGDCELYSKPYAAVMPKVEKLKNLPYVSGLEDKNWDNIDNQWAALELQLEQQKDTLAAIVFEPLVQGAGGMLIYSADLLRKLRVWATDNNVHLIADEIMTGMGRTGQYLACDWAGITPDYAVMSKGLTAGFTPMSVVITRDSIYDAFYDDYETGKAFMHSNTYCGNAISAAAALGAFQVYEQENTFKHVRDNAAGLQQRLHTIGDNTGCLTNFRGLGYVAAADIQLPDGSTPESAQRLGYQIYMEAVKRGALLRPLGNTLYFFPPLNTPDNVLDDMAAIAEESIRAVLMK